MNANPSSPNDDLAIAASDSWYYDLERRDMLRYVDKDIKTLLEFGCGRGTFAFLAKQKTGAETWGIELNEASAHIAATKLDRVEVGDATSLIGSMPTAYFDCLVFNDVLEHLTDPSALLQQSKRILAPGGKIVASIPNILFYGALRHLLYDRDFRYVDSGVFDRTHLRFFTKKSIARLFDECGLRVSILEGLPLPEGVNSRAIRIAKLLSFLEFFDEMQYMQFACVAAVPS